MESQSMMTDAQIAFQKRLEELQDKVHEQRTSTGTQAIRSYLKFRQQELDQQLRACTDGLFPRLQGASMEIMGLIDTIENGPIKLPPELNDEETDNEA